MYRFDYFSQLINCIYFADKHTGSVMEQLISRQL